MVDFNKKYIMTLILCVILLLVGCGVTQNSKDSFCEEIKEDISKNLKRDSKGIYYFDSRERMIRVENNIYFRKHYDCFNGWGSSQLFRLFGKPNFYNPRYIRYYFNESCREVGEPCIFWEFILDNNRKVDCFRERNRNFPNDPE